MELLPVLKKSPQPRVITVSSGGMLVQALNLADLQLEKMSPFDGTMAYAQNKRQQVILAEQYGKQIPEVRFWTCHPGWADTPGKFLFLFYSVVGLLLRLTGYSR